MIEISHMGKNNEKSRSGVREKCLSFLPYIVIVACIWVEHPRDQAKIKNKIIVGPDDNILLI